MLDVVGVSEIPIVGYLDYSPNHGRIGILR